MRRIVFTLMLLMFAVQVINSAEDTEPSVLDLMKSDCARGINLCCFTVSWCLLFCVCDVVHQSAKAVYGLRDATRSNSCCQRYNQNQHMQ